LNFDCNAHSFLVSSMKFITLASELMIQRRFIAMGGTMSF
jgi:hypothetical protein